MKRIRDFYFQRRAPVSVIHFVTRCCPARCRHCFIDFDDPTAFRNELTLEEIGRLTKTFGGRLFNVNLTGGEPFVRNDLYEILECYVRNAGVESVYITSNGAFPETMQRLAERFLRAEGRSRLVISVSIDDLEKEHDANRHCSGLFAKALASVRLLQTMNGPRFGVNVGVTVTPWNRERVLPLYDYLVREGVHSITTTLYRETGAAPLIDAVEMKRVVAAYAALSGRIHSDRRDGMTTGFSDHFTGMILDAKNTVVNRLLPKIAHANVFVSRCPSASLFGVIYPNGDVYPCELLPRWHLGNLKDFAMDFMKLWTSEKAATCRRFIVKSRCHCTFECAWTINILSHARYIPALIWEVGKTWLRNQRRRT